MATENIFMTTHYLANAFAAYSQLNLTFMGISNNEYENMFEGNKAFTPGDSISAIIASYPRVSTGLDLTNYGVQGYSTQVYDITLEQEGLCNVMRTLDSYTQTFFTSEDKVWDQFISPTHKAISKSIEYYIIKKLRNNVSHCPISSIQYKQMIGAWIKKSSSDGSPNNPVFLNYVLAQKAYVDKMNYMDTPKLVVSSGAANYFRQSMIPLYNEELVGKVAKDAYIGTIGSFDNLQSPELTNNGLVEGFVGMVVNGAVTNVPANGADTANIKLNNAMTVTQMVFSRDNSFDLTWLKVKTAAGKKPNMWKDGDSLCLYFGTPSNGSLSLQSCIGLTNQISQLNVTNHVPLLFLNASEAYPVGGDEAKATEWYVNVSSGANRFIIGNNAQTWKGRYLGPALSTTITDPDRAGLSVFLADLNTIGYNFEFGRIGSFTQKTIMKAPDTVLAGNRVVISKNDLVTVDGMSGVLDSYVYTDAAGTNTVYSEWGFAVCEQGLSVLNPPLCDVKGADCTTAKDAKTGKYTFRAINQGNVVQSANYYRIDTLVGVGVVPIYSYAFPMPIGLSVG